MKNKKPKRPWGLRQIGKNWYVDISHPSLSERLRFTTKTDDLDLAKKVRDAAYKKVVENSLRGKKITNITLGRFYGEIEKYSKNKNHAENTTELYKYAFKKFFRICPENTKLTDIRRSHVEDLKSLIDSKTTYNIYYNHLHAAFNYAVDWGYLRKNPCDTVKKLKPNKETRRNIHPEEFRILIQGIEKDKNFAFADALRFMYVTGLRRKEMVQLKWKDIHYELDYFEVKDTKGKVDARIPLNTVLERILKNRPKGPRPFNYRADFMTSKFKKYITKLKLPDDLVLHSTRHSTSTTLFESQEHPLIVQKLMRHKDLKTTMDYTHTMPKFLAPAIDKTTKAMESILKPKKKGVKRIVLPRIRKKRKMKKKTKFAG